MKNASEYSKKLATFLRKIKSSVTFEAPPKREAVTELILAYLQWDSTRKAAESGYTKLMSTLVDNNDLRVSHTQEIVTLVGVRYPRIEERAARMRDALNEIYNREHATSLEALVGKSKKDVRAYLDTLPGMMPYVADLVKLVSFGGSTVPVDETLAILLKGEEVVDPDATLEEITKLIEGAIKPEEALNTHYLLQAWADAQPRPTLTEPKRFEASPFEKALEKVASKAAEPKPEPKPAPKHEAKPAGKSPAKSSKK